MSSKLDSIRTIRLLFLNLMSNYVLGCRDLSALNGLCSRGSDSLLRDLRTPLCLVVRDHVVEESAMILLLVALYWLP